MFNLKNSLNFAIEFFVEVLLEGIVAIFTEIL